MILIRIALFALLSVSLTFAQKNEVKETSAIPSLKITEEDLAMIRELLKNDEFKSSFTQQCANGASPWLGVNQAVKSCKCAYTKLIKNDELLYKLATTDNDDSFEKWGYGVIEPCLPEKFSPATQVTFVNQCVKESGEIARNVCECTYQQLIKKYTVKSLVKAAFENPEKLQVNLVVMAGMCALQ